MYRKTPECLKYTPTIQKEKGAEAPFSRFLGCARRAKDAARIAKAEAITLAGLVAHVAGIEVAFEGRLECDTLEHLHAVGSVGSDKPGVRVGQEVVHNVALGNHAQDRKSTRLNSSHSQQSRMPSSA